MNSLGITAKQWLRQLRVVRAMHLLREGCQAKEVAMELEFRYRSDFTREFHTLVGMTPSAFQQTARRLSVEWGSAE